MAVVLAGCSVTEVAADPIDRPTATSVPTPITDPAPTGTTDDTTTTTTATSTTSTTAASTTTSTTPTTVGPQPNPACIATVGPGETLRTIAARYDDETVDFVSLLVENRLTDAASTAPLAVGTSVDVCPGNGVDDLTGEARPSGPVEVAFGAAAQQERLNELFGAFGLEPLTVDGVVGPVTRQRLCAARLALGLPVSTAAMVPGSDEELALFAADTVPIPYTSAIASDRWILIDQTCQVMFVGSGTERLEFVFPTSTGEAGFATRPQNRTPAYRFDPAVANGGWHNSTTYPVAGDNPLNGNMYKPLYFDGGQAIHGANNVPQYPASHGCARLRVADHDRLLAWLGIDVLTAPVWSTRPLGVTVNVQGAWQG